MKKRLIITTTTLVCLLALLAVNLNTVLHAIFANLATSELKSFDEINEDLHQNLIWFDDYYTLEYLDEKTVSIGEPRYWQENNSYLIIGNDKALLFDSGPGVRDITPVVESLTNLPIVAMISHFHYDHVGNIENFDNQVLVNNQIAEEQLGKAGEYLPNDIEYLADMANREGLEAPVFYPKKILERRSSIDLGGRVIEVIATPGHSSDSIMIFDEERNQLFSGDYIFGFVSALRGLIGSENDRDYLSSATQIVELINSDTKIYAAHNSGASVNPYEYDDIRDIQSFFLENKSTFFPKLAEINKRIPVIY